MADGPTMNTGGMSSLDVLALGASPSVSAGKGGKGASGASGGSWFEAVAAAWGQTLDGEAQKITTMSDGIGDGNEQPSQLAELSAESMRMNFMSNSENTSMSIHRPVAGNHGPQGLDALGRTFRCRSDASGAAARDGGPIASRHFKPNYGASMTDVSTQFNRGYAVCTRRRKAPGSGSALAGATWIGGVHAGCQSLR